MKICRTISCAASWSFFAVQKTSRSLDLPALPDFKSIKRFFLFKCNNSRGHTAPIFSCEGTCYFCPSRGAMHGRQTPSSWQPAQADIWQQHRLCASPAIHTRQNSLISLRCWSSQGATQLWHSTGVCVVACCCQTSQCPCHPTGVLVSLMIPCLLWVGRLLLIFPVVLIKLCFIMCCRDALRFRPHFLNQPSKSTPAHTIRTSSIFASSCTTAAAVKNIFDEWCLKRQIKKEGFVS